MNKIQERRLLNAAKATRETPDPSAFTMRDFCADRYSCGTPACVLGNYGARRDLQKTFRIVNTRDEEETKEYGPFFSFCNNESLDTVWYCGGEIQDHFGVNEHEADELFGQDGCGGATTHKQAAKYIEKFVARKRRERD